MMSRRETVSGLVVIGRSEEIHYVARIGIIDIFDFISFRL